MIKETARIIRCDQTTITIQIQRSQMCSCCKIEEQCKKNNEILQIPNTDFNLMVGDQIEIGIDDKKNLFAGLIAFFLPAVLFLSVLIWQQQRGEVISFFLAIFTVAIYYFIAFFLTRNKDKYFAIKILKKL